MSPRVILAALVAIPLLLPSVAPAQSAAVDTQLQLEAKRKRAILRPEAPVAAGVPDAEREVEARVRLPDERVGVEAGRHHDRGERAGVLTRVLAEDLQPQAAAYGTPAGLGQPRVAREDVVEPLLADHRDRFPQAEQQR